MRLNTTELQIGDIVHHYGMRILLDREPEQYPHHSPSGRVVWSWLGLVLNPQESVDGGVPRSFLCEHRWDGNEWVREQTNRWNVQGNDLAHWGVERKS